MGEPQHALLVTSAPTRPRPDVGGGHPRNFSAPSRPGRMTLPGPDSTRPWPTTNGGLFAQLGKYLERVVVTCRVIETKFDAPPAGETMPGESPLRNIHWMAVLRSCCSIEAYRRMHVGDMDPHQGRRLPAARKLTSPAACGIRRPPRLRRPEPGSGRKSTPGRSMTPSGSWAGSTRSWNTPR